MTLTADQRRKVERTRELAALESGKVREHTGDTDLGMAYAVAFGEAQWGLRELLAIIDDLTQNS